MRQNTGIDLSIIIINFNTPELTRACVQSVLAAERTQDRWEIIIIDNGSTDNSVMGLGAFVASINKQRNIQFVPRKTNGGFAVANNEGIRRSHGKFLLLLNSDTEVTEDSIRTALAVFDADKTTGVVGAKLVLPDGKLDPACHRGFPTLWASATYFSGLERLFPTSRVFAQYHQTYKDMSVMHDIDSPSGAFFLFRREILHDAGFLDEDFFMYGEDIDFAFRIKKKGWRILYVPSAVVLHHKKQSGRKSKDPTIQKNISVHFYQTMKLFYQKHYSSTYFPVVKFFIFSLLDIKIFLVRTFGR